MTNSSSTVHIYMTYNLRWEPEVLQDFTSLSHFQLLLIISLSISSKEWNTPFTEEKWHLSLSVLISLYHVPVVSCGITNASLAQCYMILNCNILLLYFKVWFHLNGAYLCLFFVYLFDFSVGDNICISITPPNCGDSDNSNLSSWKTKTNSNGIDLIIFEHSSFTKRKVQKINPAWQELIVPLSVKKPWGRMNSISSVTWLASDLSTSVDYTSSYKTPLTFALHATIPTVNITYYTVCIHLITRYTEDKILSWCQHCRHWRPPVTTKLASWKLAGFRGFAFYKTIIPSFFQRTFMIYNRTRYLTLQL